MNFLVLKCYQCSTFQVHQSKKSKKWICKICGEKQSLLKVYFEGSSSLCRQIVQDSNMKRSKTNPNFEISNSNFDNSISVTPKENISKIAKSKKDKWEVYKSFPSNLSSDEENDFACIGKRKNKSQELSCNQKQMKKENTVLHSIMHESAKKHPLCLSSIPSKGCEIKSKWSQFRSSDNSD